MSSDIASLQAQITSLQTQVSSLQAQLAHSRRVGMGAPIQAAPPPTYVSVPATFGASLVAGLVGGGIGYMVAGSKRR